MLQFMPAFWWVFAVIWCVVIIALAVRKGALHKSASVTAVPYLTTVEILMQIGSVVLACVPYACFRALRSDMTPAIRQWYVNVSIPSALVLSVALIAAVTLLIIQAHAADVSHREHDDSNHDDSNHDDAV